MNVKQILAVSIIGLAAAAPTLAQSDRPAAFDAPPPPQKQKQGPPPSSQPAEGVWRRGHIDARALRAETVHEMDGPRAEGVGPEGGTAGPRLMSPEQFDDALAIFRILRPDRAQQLDAIRKTNPERASEMIRESLPKLMELGYLKRHDPEMFKLRIDDFKLTRTTEDLARQLRQAYDAKDDAKAKGLHMQLSAKVADHFTVRQNIRDRELARLEKQIDDLRKKIDATKAAKDQLIRERIDDLTDKADRPEW